LIGKRGENGAVVTDGVANPRFGLLAQGRGPLVDPEIFRGEGNFFHGWGGRARRMRMQVLALKREWRRMEGIRLFFVR
jgi:hypothetical protein